MMMKINKTVLYLGVFLLYYDSSFKNLLSKLVKTNYYVHNELEEDNFGHEIFIECPISQNSKEIFYKLDSNEYVNRIFRRGNYKIVVVNFLYPDIFKSVVTGKFSELKGNSFFMERINDSRLEHIKAIVFRENKAIKRYKKLIYEELEAQVDVLPQTELELPFKYKTESMFYTCQEKYLMTNLY